MTKMIPFVEQAIAYPASAIDRLEVRVQMYNKTEIVAPVNSNESFMINFSPIISFNVMAIIKSGKEEIPVKYMSEEMSIGDVQQTNLEENRKRIFAEREVSEKDASRIRKAIKFYHKSLKKKNLALNSMQNQMQVSVENPSGQSTSTVASNVTNGWTDEDEANQIKRVEKIKNFFNESSDVEDIEDWDEFVSQKAAEIINKASIQFNEFL